VSLLTYSVRTANALPEPISAAPLGETIAQLRHLLGVVGDYAQPVLLEVLRLDVERSAIVLGSVLLVA
jgi:hypothetical protein